MQSPSLSPRRTLIASHYNATRQVYCSAAYEVAHVIAECEGGTILAPGLPTSRARTEADRIAAFASRQAGFGNRPHIAPAALEEDCDLFVYTAAWLHDVAELRRIPNWRRRSRYAVAILFEGWPQNLQTNRPHFHELREFDLVIHISQSAAAALAAQSGADIRFVPAGCDAERLCPFPTPPLRVIDVYAQGRQPQAQHDQLLALNERADFFYHYDTADGTFAVVFHRHVRHRADMMKRTRIFPCYGLRAVENRKRHEAGAHDLTPMRFYDAAAAGAFVIGEPPDLDDYRENFDWPDACVFASGAGHDYAGLVASLLRDPERMARASARGVVQSLRRHDWAYRWRDMLALAGLAPAPLLSARAKRLEALAACADDEEMVLRPWLSEGLADRPAPVLAAPALAG